MAYWPSLKWLFKDFGAARQKLLPLGREWVCSVGAVELT
jgi:hypothetical protein